VKRLLGVGIIALDMVEGHCVLVADVIKYVIYALIVVKIGVGRVLVGVVLFFLKTSLT